MNAGQPNINGNVSIMNMTNNSVTIYWDPIVDEDCAMNTTTTVYDVSVSSSNGQATASSIAISRLTETSAMISNVLPGTEYNVSVSVGREDQLGNNSCFAGNYPGLLFTITSSKGK